MEEFPPAYLIFKANDLIVDIASPNGGKVDLGKFTIKQTNIEQHYY